MTITPYKVRALLRKDLKNDLRNGTTVLFLLLPIMFTVIYQSMGLGEGGMPTAFVTVLCLLMNTCMFPISGTAMFIAEEKEKHTLRTLMLSNVSAGDFLLSKGIIAYSLTELVNLVIYAITRPDISLPFYVLVTSLAVLCLMMLGAIVGIVSRNQMSTGVMASPLMLLMMLPAIFSMMNESIERVAQFTPTHALISLILGDGQMGFRFAVLIGWLILCGVLFAFVFRRNQLD